MTANPSDTDRLRIDKEMKEVDRVFRGARLRDKFEIVQKWAVEAIDIQTHLKDTLPRFVHFSGHGAGNEGLAFENALGFTQYIDADTLGDTFALEYAQTVECVFLNACYSEDQAAAIAQRVSYVIGMKAALDDKAAAAFSMGFYQALGDGKSIEEAFKAGHNNAKLAGIKDNLAPVLYKNGIV
jgi:hypothetical protein